MHIERYNCTLPYLKPSIFSHELHQLGETMATKNEQTETKFGNFLDNIWLQLLIATLLTVAWQVWVFYEILLKN